MDNEELKRLLPKEVTDLARRMAALSPEHTLALLDGVACTVVKPDHALPRKLQMVSGEQLAFTTRLLDAIGMLRAIVHRRVDHGHKAEHQMS